MRFRSFRVLRQILLILPSAFVPWATAQDQTRTVKVDCAPVLQKMRTDFATEPGRLMLAMEDALTTSEPCVCSIVRTAVDLAGRDSEITAQILITALRQMPASAARITECILQEAPAAAPAIRVALARELGEKAPELLAGQRPEAPEAEPLAADPGKNPIGKNPLPPTPEESPIALDSETGNLPSVGISGIYITSRAGIPASALPSSVPLKVIHRPVFTTKKPAFPTVLPVTQSTPD